MARPAYPQHGAPPPPPLPAATRTVGQVVGESVKYYRENFFASLTLGLGPGLTAIGVALLHGWAQFAYWVGVGGVGMTISFIAATILLKNLDIERGRVFAALVTGFVIFIPVPFLVQLWVIPALAWLSLVGLAVPAILAERLGVAAGLRRAIRLGRTDFVHILGSLATLVILSFLFGSVLFFLLRSQGDAVRTVATFFSLLVVSPMLFLGSVIVFDDQVARVDRPLTRAEKIAARRQHVATAPREIVPTRPGRAARPRRPKAD